MENDKKKKYELVYQMIRFVFISLFFCFLAFYVMAKDTYDEHKNHQKKVFTEEQIKKFEKDVREGKEIDIQEYLVYEDKIEKNGKKIGLNVSVFIEKYAKMGIIRVFKTINNFVDN